MSNIALTVLDDLRLFIEPEEIARDAEHNSAVFTITQPASLDVYQCRAEVKNTQRSVYVLVTNHTFALTNDMAVAGICYIQLVYSNGSDTLRKTRVAACHITASLNALDPSAPGFGDGLSQLQGACFADAGTLGTELIFTNISGREVKRVAFPGSGLDEVAADQLYLRRDGRVPMDATIQMQGVNRGIVFDATGSGSVIYTDGMGLRLRRGTGNQPITIEDASGAAASRSEIMTEARGDARYPSIAYVNGSFVPVDGGQIVGPIRHLAAPPPASADTLVTREYVDGKPIGITEVQGDARYLRLTGGQVAGILSMATGQPFISAMGAGNQPMLCIGSNDSGYWRSGANVVFEVGRSATWIHSATGSTIYQPLSLAVAPTASNHAVPKGYVDTFRADAMLVAMGSTLVLTNAFQSVISVPYAIPRGGNSRVLVTVSGGLRIGTAGQIVLVQVRCPPSDIVQNVFAYSFLDGATVESSGVHLSFPVDVGGTVPVLNVEMRMITGAPVSLIGGAGEAQRTTVTFADMGPR